MQGTVRASRSLGFVAAAIVTLVMLVAGPATRASADDPQSQQDRLRQQQNQVQSDLDLAKASDDAVEADVARLGQAVADQSAKVDDARAALAAASASVDERARRLAAVEARVRDLRQELARRAVTEYVDPAETEGVLALARTATLDEAEQRQALLDVVQATRTELMEGLRASREDEAATARELAAARKLASDRAAQEASVLKGLQDAQTKQEAAHAELQRRIDELQAESRELAAHEQDLENLIRRRAAAVAAARAADPVAFAASTGTPGTASAAGFIWPAHGPVTSEFGPRWGGFHPGIDIAAPYGAPIVAAKAGIVVFAGPNDGYGNFVVIDHGDGFATAYAHQSSLAVKDGQTVAQGQVIGFVGSTGFSTGPHLHFEIRVNGTAQNPRNFEVGNP